METKTGLVFDDRMAEHECTWDASHLEKPSRYLFSLKRCKEYGLVDRCVIIPSKAATEEELLLVHTKDYINDIKSSKYLTNESDLEALASKYDSVYFNNKTYDSALLAAGSTLQLVSSVLNGKVNNGMAIVRPPGHHALLKDACGFCYFNNVAIAAEYAIQNFNLSRILIVDWDVHHGQATQRKFYDNPKVLYFSIHRYQNGAFWPHLRESNFDYTGGDCAKGCNINVPLNGSGQGNAEYLAIFNNILLPVAYEFSPELVLISAGYDAALGCPEGEMKVSPSAYPHFVKSLSCLANGRICVVLEGGYCVSSLSESVALTLRELLGDPTPLIGPCISINQISVDTILNVLSVQHFFWDSVKLQKLYKTDTEYNGEKHFVHIEYTGNPLEGFTEFPTREYNPIVLPHVTSMLETELRDLISKTDLSVPPRKTCFILSSKHKHNTSVLENKISSGEIEKAARLVIKMMENNILSKCTLLELSGIEPTDLDSILNQKGIEKIKSSSRLSEEISSQLEKKFTQNFCHLFNVGLLQLVDAVMNRFCVNGFSLTYSEERESLENKSEFCTFNAVALAASYLIEKYSVKRILIIDWSIDHNNNIQRIFYNDDKVLSISLHYCGKKSCPMSIQEIGSNEGKGYNINIPFIHAVTDGDFLAALFHIILPICYEFCPDFTLISSTFNSECFSLLSPSCYGVIIKLLSALCNGKMVVDIEGWDQDNAFEETVQCISSLLGEAKVPVCAGVLKPCPDAIEMIQNVVKVQKKYWKSLAFHKALPSVVPSELRAIPGESKLRQSSDPVAIPKKLDEPGTSKMSEWLGEAAGFDPGVELYCVTPLEYCPHLELLQPIPLEGLNPFARCSSCNDPNENWVCLHCYQVYCGRFIGQHMLQHGRDMQHFLTLSYSDLSVWCYACDAYIHNQQLVPIKEHAHDKKFG